MDVEQSSALLKCVLSSGGWGALRPSLGHIGILTILVAAACHKGVTYLVLYPLFRLLFGTLYPAYASYKAVRTKNVKEYVKWMMYWIVFALFTCIETFTDVFLSWFPFYYEIKIILVIWLLSPATKGSSFLYRKFVHPMLSSREQEIDDYISKAKEQSYKQVLDLGSKGMTALMQTALKTINTMPGPIRQSASNPSIASTTSFSSDEADLVRRSITAPDLKPENIDLIEMELSNELPPPRPKAVKKGGGGIVNQLRKSYSLGDLSDPSLNEDQDERDVVITDPRLRRRRISPHRSSSTSSATIYFSEVDIRADRLAHIQSAEDISSGYSSAEGLYASGQPKLQARESLSRTGSLTRSRTVRSTRSSTVPKKTSSVPSDESDENEVFDTNIIFLNDKVRAIDRLAEEKTESSSEGEFLDTLDNLHGNKELNGNVSVLTACLDSKTDRSLIPNPKFSERMIKLREQVEDAYVKIKEAVVSNDKIVSLTPTEVNHDSKLVEHNRGGRYNKKMAPVPPIKATLVLKPGVVKNIGTSESCKEIFMHSPKAKRRSLSNASSSSKSKLNPLTKLMKLPKKMGFWKEGLSLSDSKKQSKSANDLPTVSSNSGSQLSLNNPNKSPRGSQLSLIKSGSQLSVKSLTESPLAHRRLKVVRKLIDEDLD